MLTPRLHHRIALRHARHQNNYLPSIITHEDRCAIVERILQRWITERRRLLTNDDRG
jgi:hypothetical protein